MIPLPPRATSMNVTAMNGAGQVVGYVTQGEGTENDRAFIWSEAGGYKALGATLDCPLRLTLTLPDDKECL